MREIKFRQPVIVDGKLERWHYWGVMLENKYKNFIGPLTGAYYTDSNQYTGLKDKNGKEIYEGDIVKHEGKIGVVVNDCGCAAIFTKEETYIYGYNWHIEELEIIGNIYENKFDFIKNINNI